MADYNEILNIEIAKAVEVISKLEFVKYLQKNMTKELSGSWNYDFQVVADDLYTAPDRNDIITEEGQQFRVTNVTKEREGEETYINVQARHIAFDLEDIYVIKGKVEIPESPAENINIDYSHDGWLVEYQLKATLHAHLIQLFEFAPGFTVGTVPSTEAVTVTVTSTDVFSNLKKILDRFNCGYLLNNQEISAEKYEDMIDGESIANMHYSVNNINMSRELPYQDVVNKLYAEAEIVPDDPNQNPQTVVIEKGAGYPEYFVNFGQLEEGELVFDEKLDQLAQDYFDIRNNPSPRYSVNIVELKKHPTITGPYEFDTGDIVNVVDPGLGLDEDMVVVSYSYSLLEDTIDSYTSQVHLGRLDQERLPPDFEVFERKKQIVRFSSVDLKEIVQMTRDYIVEQIFGGTSKDLHEIIIKHANRHTRNYPLGIGWNHEVFTGSADYVGLDNAVAGLNNFVNDPEGALKYYGGFEVFDPVEFVKEEVETTPSRFDFENIMNHWIDTYIQSSTNLSNSINTIYVNVFGSSGTVSSETIENQPEHIMERIEGMVLFSGLWKDSVTSVINSALSKAGNPTGIYNEIGGGRNGFVPAINAILNEISNTKVVDVEESGGNLVEQRKQINPKIFTSQENPDDGLGTNGDIWLQFEGGE